MGEGEGRVFDGSVPEGETLRSGDVIRRPATPDEVAREEARIAQTQAAADYMLGRQPEVSTETEEDLKRDNPEAIISSDVPKVE